MEKVIDVWCNIFTPEGMKKYYVAPPELKEVVDRWNLGERTRGYSVEDFCKILDESHVEKIIMPATKIRSFLRGEMIKDMTIQEIHGIIKENPDRFKGMMGINPFKRMEGVRELEMAVREFGFVAAHIIPFGFGIPLNDAMFYPFFAKCVELDIPVMIQVGHSAEFMPSRMGQPILLDDVALYFPELKIIAAHTGWPWVEELIALAWKHPNVYIATTAHAPKYWDRSLVAFLNSRGKNKVLYGTNFPVLTHADSLAQIESLGLKEEAKRKLLWENAARVFKF
jgi:predicted TIM-barrel fold metal-dependent hydrolase